jgi:hypothetical protein
MDWKKLVPGRKLPNFRDAAFTFGELAGQAFLQAAPRWIAGYAADLAQGRPITAYLIYLPTFVGWGKETNISTGTKIGGKPLQFVAGASGLKKIGSLLGLGVRVAKSNLQLLRMDYHPFDDGHGGVGGLKTGELTILHDGPYHMHVYGWGHRSG